MNKVVRLMPVGIRVMLYLQYLFLTFCWLSLKRCSRWGDNYRARQRFPTLYARLATRGKGFLSLLSRKRKESLSHRGEDNCRRCFCLYCYLLFFFLFSLWPLSSIGFDLWAKIKENSKLLIAVIAVNPSLAALVLVHDCPGKHGRKMVSISWCTV